MANYRANWVEILDSVRMQTERKREVVLISLQEVEEKRNEALAKQKIAEEKCNELRKKKEEKHAEIIEKNKEYEATWGEFNAIRDRNNPLIETLEKKSNLEHQLMLECKEKAKQAYGKRDGNRSKAPVYAEEAREHEQYRDNYNKEVRILRQEIYDAKTKAEQSGVPRKTDASEYRAIKSDFEQAKECHAYTVKKCKDLNSSWLCLKDKIVYYEKILLIIEESFRREKLDAKEDIQMLLDKAGVERYDDGVKIVEKSDGTTHIYYGGGLDESDGPGHGHIVLDGFGQKIYDRGVLEEHGGHNFIDDEDELVISRLMSMDDADDDDDDDDVDQGENLDENTEDANVN